MDDARIFYYNKKKKEIERISILMCFIPQLVSCTNKDGTNCYIHVATHDYLKLKRFERFQL